MRTMSKITGVSVVCSTVSSGTDQRKHQSSVSLVFVRGIYRWPVTLTKGQWRGKCFHLMTSSWSNHGKQSADRTVYGLVKFNAFLILDCISVISPNIVWLTGATPAKNTANAAGALRNALTACNTLEGTKRFSGAVWISARNGQRTS